VREECVSPRLQYRIGPAVDLCFYRHDFGRRIWQATKKPVSPLLFKDETSFD
jgi:hypothetical protein